MNFDKKLNKLLSEDSKVSWDDLGNAMEDIGDYFSIDSYFVDVKDNNVHLEFYRGSESNNPAPESKEGLLDIMQWRIDELSKELQSMISTYHEVNRATGEYTTTVEG